MYVLSLNMWFQKLMRQFFFAIDKIVYNFIPTIYDLLISIARTSPLSQGDILEMADRIYKLLAIFMVFKVTFSLIMYVVNPDDFSDKTKGISKLGTNIIISLALLILVPYIFNYAYQLQTIILEDNSLAKLVFGEKTENNFLNTAGEEMAFITISPFFTPNTSIEELYECTNLLEKSSDGNPIFNASCSGLNENYESNGDVTSLYKLVNNNFSETDLKNYVAGVNAGSLGLMFRQDLALATTEKNEDFIMDYKYIFSTVVGVVVILLLITFCLDVAVRSIKLAFLQLIAPIPIISYVDPKSGKDGLFKKWYQMCFKTFLSLFIRLLALYFAVYIISKIDSLVDIVNGSYQSSMLIKIFIIVGALMFAKQLPKILEGLGIKLDGGGFTLNPLRKVEKEALGGNLLKKPNDMLAKTGKAILKSPLSGMSLLGKKTIGGIDAARNGKGFKQGWDRTHGKLHNNFYKKLDELAPDSAEARKNARQGKENIHRMDEKFKFGETVYKNAHGDDKRLNFSAPYRASYDAMNKAKGEMYAAEAKKQAEIANVEERLKRGSIDQEQAQKEIKEINKEAGTATKRYEVAKARHDEMKKIYTKDAMIEDAYDYYDKTASEFEKSKFKLSSTSQVSNESSSVSQATNKPNSSSSQIIFDDSTYPASSDNRFATEEREKRQNAVNEELNNTTTEIDELLNKSEDIDQELNDKVKKLRDELEDLIHEKENNHNKQELDEINQDIDKIKEEIDQLLGNGR